uniref:Uncharacterized protein n=1 Tax=Cacopsylla melanoneura TaxID=428564 RepID=A0A8D9EXG6_9HEMI
MNMKIWNTSMIMKQVTQQKTTKQVSSLDSLGNTFNLVRKKRKTKKECSLDSLTSIFIQQVVRLSRLKKGTKLMMNKIEMKDTGLKMMMMIGKTLMNKMKMMTIMMNKTMMKTKKMTMSKRMKIKIEDIEPKPLEDTKDTVLTRRRRRRMMMMMMMGSQ